MMYLLIILAAIAAAVITRISPVAGTYLAAGSAIFGIVACFYSLYAIGQLLGYMARDRWKR